MNQSCGSCKNTRRQLLMLKCNHDVCIKCAADNYFLHSKNKLNSRRTKPTNYFCEKCLEQTEIDQQTIETLRKYFIDNVTLDEKNKLNRKDKISERDIINRQRLQKISKLDKSTTRPKSLQIEMADKKRALSKYLSDKQIEKFIQMQNEYGHPKKPHLTNRGGTNQNPNLPQQRSSHTPQLHKQQYSPLIYMKQPSQTPKPYNKASKGTLNEYELQQVITDHNNKKEYNSRKQQYNDSFEVFSQEEKRFNDYENQMKLRARNNQRYNSNNGNGNNRNEMTEEAQYEIYHNGKAAGYYNTHLTKQLLEERERQRDTQRQRQSDKDNNLASNSLNKPVGTIRSKQSSSKDHLSPTTHKHLQDNIKYKLKMASSRSQNQLNRYNQIRNAAIRQDYNQHFVSNTVDLWQSQSKSAKKHTEDKTVPHLQKKSVENMEKILEHMQLSDLLMREKEIIDHNRHGNGSKKMLKTQSYYCKIHQDEEIIYFCMKCNQLICSQCALHGSHKAHQIHSLKKTTQSLYQKLNQNMNSLLRYITEQQSKEKIYRQCLNQISIEHNKQKQKIRTSFQTFIFLIDKKYKDLLKDIEDKYQGIHGQYNDRLSETRKNMGEVNAIRQKIDQTIAQYNAYQLKIQSQNNITNITNNQIAPFTLKKHNNNNHLTNIHFIHQITNRTQELNAFVKQSNILIFSNSNKKESLLSENSTFKLSESSNLLEENHQLQACNGTPSTNTLQGFSKDRLLSPHKGRKIITNCYQINAKSHIKMASCSNLVQYLRQIQEIIKGIKLEWVEYQLKALL